MSSVQLIYLFSGLLLVGLLVLAITWTYFQKELRKLQDEALQLQRHRTDFIANLSHELKTPLTSIKGYTETLRDGAVTDPTKASQFLRKIEDNVERLDLLIHDILDLSRLEATDEHLRVEKINLPSFFKSLQEQFSHRLSQKSQLLTISTDLEEIRADPRLLEQALSNLVANAHRYCPEGALIELKAKPVSIAGRSFYQIEVADNGPGIGEADLPRVFERFYRADKSRNRASGGTGLGLAIVKHIVLSHGGQVRARNLERGGVCFSLAFPAS